MAFLLAALSSLHLTQTITKNGLKCPAQVITIKPGEKVAPLPTPGANTVGQGVPAGTVYRLTDGRLIYVQKAP